MMKAVCRILFVLSIMMTGCQRDRNDPESNDRERSTMGVMADGVTGRYAIEAGQRARESIEAINHQRQQEADELLEAF